MKTKYPLSTQPKWHILIPSILVLIWCAVSILCGFEYHLVRHQLKDRLLLICSVLFLIEASFHYTVSSFAVSIRFLGIPVRRMFWDSIACVVIIEGNGDKDQIRALFVSSVLDPVTVASLTTEQIREGKWKNSISLTLAREQLHPLCTLAKQCGKEVIVR